jgi:hypothetical protein
LRPYLIVGCGGSGGVTLQFMIDQIRADLQAKGVTTIPRAWQFLHIDVPQAADGVRQGLPPLVSDAEFSDGNGRYLGVAQPASLAAQRKLEHLGCWQSDPSEINTPISTGAGQKRSVGRVATLSALSRIREGITDAVNRMRAAGTREELRALIERVSPGSGDLADSAPVCIVVSSMAGGAGASMVLDVCRLIGNEPALNSKLTGLFLYTPEIFDSLQPSDRQDVPGNALAMTGELLAAQLGSAAEDDQTLFRDLGIGMAGGGNQTSFGRVIPIGARIGVAGALFADGDLDSIYRGVGRGLAALIQSPSASQNWIAYDLTNGTSRPDELEHFGWGAEADAVQWGSFGFAQLSTGRDRYGEYSAQRIARVAVDRLTRGHFDANTSGTDLEQLDRRVDERYPAILRSVGLPTSGSGDTRQWFRGILAETPKALSEKVVSTNVDPLFKEATGALPGREWLESVQQRVLNRASAMHASSTDAAYAFVHGWYLRFMDLTTEAVTQSLSSDGIPTTRGLLERLGRDVDAWAQEVRQGGALTAKNPTRVPDSLRAQISQLKGNINDRHAFVGQLRDAYHEAVETTMVGEAATLMAGVLSTMRTQFLVPLQEACSDALRTLQSASNEQAAGGGLAQLRTDKYALWPKAGQQVPARFAHAQNEVLLIDADTFDSQFASHLVASVRTDGEADPSPSVAISSAVREVIANRWPTTGTPPTDVIVVDDPSWRPNVLDHEPGYTETVSSRIGRFGLAVTPQQLLDRARQWVARPRMPFDQFITASLRDYVTGEGISESVRAERRNEIANKFRQTLELAEPLVAVNPHLVTALHAPSEPHVVYKFSDVPFEGLELGNALVNDISQRESDSRSEQALRNALTSQSSATRIDVFGSFAPLSPLVFTSLFNPLATGWAGLIHTNLRERFWAHRRSRRLVAGTAFTDQNRRALVGGWYVARFTGRLRLPGEMHALEAVQVYDDDRGEWLSFPTPLVVPRSVLTVDTSGYLPAVLLSFGLAMATAASAGSLDSLKPYTVLRRIWDDTPTGYPEHAPIETHPATKRLDGWIRGEPVPSESPSRLAQTSSAAENHATLTERITSIQESVGDNFLRPGQLGARGGGAYSIIDRPEAVFAVPLFHEIAEDVYRQLTVIQNAMVSISVTASHGPTIITDI